MGEPQLFRPRGPLVPRIFRRADMFYMLFLPDDDDLAAHAECNPGTLRIEDIFGNCLWPAPPVEVKGP